MTITREQFDYMWAYNEGNSPELLTNTCNRVIAEDMEPQFTDEDNERMNRLSEFYLTPEEEA